MTKSLFTLIPSHRHRRWLALLALLGGAFPVPQVAGQTQGQFTSAIRGTVRDADTRSPIAGATVQTVGLQPAKGVLTDEMGRFLLEGLPVGRVSIQVTYLGYAPQQLNNLVLNTGRDVQLEIFLTESVVQAQAVEITASSRDPEARQPINDFATISSRGFTVEQANRYAGTLQDPSRMALNFAGTSQGGDSRNDIVVRGNSPLGVLWRMEGIDIPNPNHFATQGANGGPISILNNSTLANSDFLTGAFPAEYSNGYSGVFDLRLRNGNPSRREHFFQIGFNGVELLTEGPISKKHGSSYLIDYRYSTLAFFDAVGIQFGGLLGVPFFQDLTLKVNLPTEKLGTFSLFGIGGLSNIDILESELTDEEFREAEADNQLVFDDFRGEANLGVLGLSHTALLGKKGFWRNTVAYTIQDRTSRSDTLQTNEESFENAIITPEYGERSTNQRIAWASQLNYKLSPKHNLRFGAFLDLYFTELTDSVSEALGPFVTLRDIDEQTTLVRAYGQYQWRPTDRWALTAGLSGIYYSLSEQLALEPRLGLRYQLTEKQNLTLGYGMHQQIQPIALSFARDENGQTSNEDLDFTRSQHFILGTERSLGPNTRLKLEAYYQYLDRLPIDTFPSTFSGLNTGLGFGRVPEAPGLVSDGTARTYGIELTLERFFTRGYYFLVTGSLFDSQYEASDGKDRNTAFNNGYVVNVLWGLERPTGRQQQNAFFADVKLALAGGLRYTPVDLPASIAAGRGVPDRSQEYEAQTEPYFRPDLKFGFRRNFKKWSQEISVTLQNVIGYENVFVRDYNPRTQQEVDRFQLGFFPVVQYALRFR